MTFRIRTLLWSSQNVDPICLLSELEHRLKLALPRCQQRIAIYLWILFLRNVMPRTPPPGQGKKWSQRKITTFEIHCTKKLLFCAYFWKTTVHECQHEWNSTGYRKRKLSSQWQFLVIWYCSLKIHYTILYFRLWCKYSSYLAWHQHSGPYNINLSTN